MLRIETRKGSAIELSQNEIIAKRLSELRKEKKYTQDEIAEKIKVKRATIANYESGNRAPDYETIIKLADIYGVSCDYIIRGVESEFADINRITGLSNESIKALEAHKKSFLYSFTIEYILCNHELLRKLGVYLMSALYEEYNRSDYYKYLPHKKQTIFLENPEIARKISFSDLIERLPFDKEKMTDFIIHNPKTKDKLLLEMACKAVDIRAVEYDLDINNYNEYIYDESIDGTLSMHEITDEETDLYKAEEFLEKRESFERLFIDKLNKLRSEKGGE